MLAPWQRAVTRVEGFLEGETVSPRFQAFFRDMGVVIDGPQSGSCEHQWRWSCMACRHRPAAVMSVTRVLRCARVIKAFWQDDVATAWLMGVMRPDQAPPMGPSSKPVCGEMGARIWRTGPDEGPPAPCRFMGEPG